MPRRAADRLAQLLKALEQGHPWPSQLTTVKCAYLAKTPTLSFDPLQYRGLLIASALYRFFLGRLSLCQLKGWQKSWRRPQLCSGVAGAGAQDAWYGIAARVEAARATNKLAITTALDLFKAFDQVNRSIVYYPILASVFAVGPLTAYAQHSESMNNR